MASGNDVIVKGGSVTVEFDGQLYTTTESSTQGFNAFGNWNLSIIGLEVRTEDGTKEGALLEIPGIEEVSIKEVRIICQPAQPKSSTS